MVECDLAKVEVAGSNPVSRSILYRRGPCTPAGALGSANASTFAPPLARLSQDVPLLSGGYVGGLV